MNEKIPTPMYAVGKTVSLLSGGPKMTVEAISVALGDCDVVAYRCIWFDHALCLQRDTFREETLIGE